MREQNLEQLFRNGLSNLEADVNPNAWANISQELQAPAPSQYVPDGSPVVKSLGLWKYVGLFVAGLAVVITAWIYSSETKQETPSADNSTALVAENSTSSQPVVLNTLSPLLIKETSAKRIADNKISEQIVAENPVVENKSGTEKKETFPAENRKEVAPESSNVTASSQQPAVEQPASPSNNVAPDNSDALVKENDFVIMNEQHDSNFPPREQESRSDFTLYIPTAFTPNGDLSNDDFKVIGLNFKEYQLVIYDGKSNEVFRSNDVEQKWDGKRKDGSLAPAGIYAVMINVKDLNNVEHPYQGQLLLKR